MYVESSAACALGMAANPQARRSAVEFGMDVEQACTEVSPMTKRRILVIEDDPAVATMYQAALSFAGFDAAVVGDGLTALEEIDEEHPDLVVLDLHLPHLDGATILRELAITPDTRYIPVIVVTGDHDDQLPEAQAVLRKPCDPALLVAAVEQQFQRAAA
jgi:DNA-binding response OmpR family regulator